MKVFAFHIQKGGVGKTTMTGNVGYALALKGKKTIMIDADPQGSLSTWFLKKSPPHELAEVLDKKVTAEDAIVKLNEHLYLLPTFGLEENLKTFAETQLINKQKAFLNLTRELADLDFEYCVFDLSPGMSLLEKRIIAECNEVITPLTAEFFSLDGIEIFTNHLKRINEDFTFSDSKKVSHHKIVLNMVNRTFKQHLKIISEIEKKDYQIYKIAQDRKVSDIQVMQESIFYYPASKTISEFNRLANDLIGG